MPKTDADVNVQLIVNLVALNERGEIALTRYETEDERWWLPGSDLQPFAHPDALAAELAASISPQLPTPNLHHLESFRGRRGWHLMFNYLARLPAQATCDPDYTLFPSSALPRMFHGTWERSVIDKMRAR